MRQLTSHGYWMPYIAASNYIPMHSTTRCLPQTKQLLEKIEKRLAGWKSSVLSLAGRLTLINTDQRAYRSTGCRCFKCQWWWLKESTTIVTNFYGDIQIRPTKESTWQAGTRYAGQGDFVGISDLRILNRALLLKWWWRFFSDTDQRPWQNLIRKIYYSSRTPLESSSYLLRIASPFWRSFIKLSHLFTNIPPQLLGMAS